MEEGQKILFIDKPVGITSFDVLRRLRRKLGTKKLGHAGTLDPRASGLMIVGVDEGTKLLKHYVGLSKEYIAEVRIGERRTTGDLDGEVVESCEVPAIAREDAKGVLTGMTGIIRLEVSVYSAMKRGGIPFYKRAREAEKTGEVVRPPIRDMEVIEVELLELTCAGGQCILTVRFVVGSGTYIRSLGEELGRRLGYPATLQSLRRTKVGGYVVEEAQPVSSIGEEG